MWGARVDIVCVDFWEFLSRKIVNNTSKCYLEKSPRRLTGNEFPSPWNLMKNFRLTRNLCTQCFDQIFSAINVKIYNIFQDVTTWFVHWDRNILTLNQEIMVNISSAPPRIAYVLQNTERPCNLCSYLSLGQYTELISFH